MVTAGTYGKAHFLNTPARRDFFQERLFAGARESGWELQAWAVLSNHYHFVGQSGDNPDALRVMINQLHMTTAKHFNLWDDKPGRRVWYQPKFRRRHGHKKHKKHKNSRLNHEARRPGTHPPGEWFQAEKPEDFTLRTPCPPHFNCVF